MKKDTHYLAVKALLKRSGVDDNCSQVTHIFRGSAARMADPQGASERDIARAGRWDVAKGDDACPSRIYSRARLVLDFARPGAAIGVAGNGQASSFRMVSTGAKRREKSRVMMNSNDIALLG